MSCVPRVDKLSGRDFIQRLSPLASFLHTMIAGAGRRSVMRKDKIDGGERCFSLTADAAAGDADPAADA